TRCAATSSWVESGLDAHRATSAPPALSAMTRFAVSVVTCRHAESRRPASGFSRLKRSRIWRRTGICRSAHSVRRRPLSASERSRTSCWTSVPVVIRSPSSSKACGRSEVLDPVGPLPCEEHELPVGGGLGVGLPTEMSVRGGGPEHGPPQPERLDDRRRPEVEDLPDGGLDPLRWYPGGPEGIHV